ncbi:MAG: peptidoglycan DD-metalloendopeptidase family protein [Actinomycetaceae bacterium]|nr:peptidoglycan DD-metalloendopeptidase family protein [Actinomycetaceae bacterium]
MKQPLPAVSDAPVLSTLSPSTAAPTSTVAPPPSRPAPDPRALASRQAPDASGRRVVRRRRPTGAPVPGAVPPAADPQKVLRGPIALSQPSALPTMSARLTPADGYGTIAADMAAPLREPLSAPWLPVASDFGSGVDQLSPASAHTPEITDDLFASADNQDLSDGAEPIDVSSAYLRAVGRSPRATAQIMNTPTRRGRRTRSGVRLALVSTLAATTVALPLSGFIAPGSETSVAAVNVVRDQPGGATWVTVSPSVTAAESLGEDLGAASRSRVRSPLVVSSCVPARAADGSRQITVQQRIVWPIAQNAYEITSGFAMRISPVSGQLMMHEGIDMSAPMDEPLYSIAEGTVVEVSENSRSGALVKIKHEPEDGKVFYSMYLHQYMNKITVKVGDKVTAGQHIGAVGSNGWSTGPHLHFEIHNERGEPVDPEAWLKQANASHVGVGC